MSIPYVGASTPSMHFGQSFTHAPQFVRYEEPQQFLGSSIHHSQHHLFDSGFIPSPQSNYYLDNSQSYVSPPSQVPQTYQGTRLGHPDQLGFTIEKRKGGLVQAGQGRLDEITQHPESRIQEHVRTQHLDEQEEHQDMEGLNMIRVQATRIDNLLDRIEVLQKEVSRKSEVLKDRDTAVKFWEKQYVHLQEDQSELAISVEEKGFPEVTAEINNYIVDKRVIEKKIHIKLREIEEYNNELAYYKSMCTPNEDEQKELKRLQEIEQQLLAKSVKTNKSLLTVGYKSRRA